MLKELSSQIKISFQLKKNTIQNNKKQTSICQLGDHVEYG